MEKDGKVIVMAADQGGYEMKEYLKGKLSDEGYRIRDFGSFSSESIDYPDVVHPLAHSIDQGEYERGIILCGSGNGAQITANKYLHVRAALCWNEEQARLAREHNNANILSLPGRVIDFELAYRITLIFLQTGFSGGRHARRVEKISRLIK